LKSFKILLCGIRSDNRYSITITEEDIHKISKELSPHRSELFLQYFHEFKSGHLPQWYWDVTGEWYEKYHLIYGKKVAEKLDKYINEL